MSGTPTRCFVGLDLGGPGQYTALAVLQRREVGRDDPPANRRPPYDLRHLHRFQMGTPYPDVIAEVRRLLNTPPLPGCVLVVDQTGVGRAVLDLVADGLRNNVTCTFCPVTITLAHHATVEAGQGLHVPKAELASGVQVILQTRRLRVASSLPDAPLLVKELETFQVRPPAAKADDVTAWREGQNDDLVLALASTTNCIRRHTCHDGGRPSCRRGVRPARIGPLGPPAPRPRCRRNSMSTRPEQPIPPAPTDSPDEAGLGRTLGKPAGTLSASGPARPKPHGRQSASRPSPSSGGRR